MAEDNDWGPWLFRKPTWRRDPMKWCWCRARRRSRAWRGDRKKVYISCRNGHMETWEQTG